MKNLKEHLNSFVSKNSAKTLYVAGITISFMLLGYYLGVHNTKSFIAKGIELYMAKEGDE